MKKDINRTIDIMGIVNLTDDSYWSESRHLLDNGAADIKKVMETVDWMISEGASIIDIGACSSRPGSTPIGAGQEWQRLSEVLPIMKREYPGLRISVDTYYANVVERVYDSIGDFIVNDISAGEDDPQMLETVGKLALDYVAMHKRGTSNTMQGLCNYEDVVKEVKQYFEAFALKAEAAGIKNWILDPGIGFAKTIEQNYSLIGSLEQFSTLGHRILVGVSRKSMIYKLFGITPNEALPQTAALHLAALERGADILRVHDVAEASRCVQVYRYLNK